MAHSHSQMTANGQKSFIIFTESGCNVIANGIRHAEKLCHCPRKVLTDAIDSGDVFYCVLGKCTIDYLEEDLPR